METYPKEKFHFIYSDGSYKEPKEGDMYIDTKKEYSFKYPFIKKVYIQYDLENGVWVRKGKV